MMTINRQGCTRIVILTKSLAVKFPNFLSGWTLFLKGLLANMQERGWSKMKWDGFCPVLFSLPGGWLVVMRRAREMTIDEFLAFDVKTWVNRGEYVIPVEHEPNSFGYLDGQIVAIDYGQETGGWVD